MGEALLLGHCVYFHAQGREAGCRDMPFVVGDRDSQMNECFVRDGQCLGAFCSVWRANDNDVIEVVENLSNALLLQAPLQCTGDCSKYLRG